MLRVLAAYSRDPDKVRRWLYNALLVVAAVALAVVIYEVRTQGRHIAREEAERASEKAASSQARVTLCYTSIVGSKPQLRLIEDQIVIAANQEAALQSNLAAFPHSPRRLGPSGWLASLVRTQRTIDDLDNFAFRVRLRTPTVQACNRLADRLHVRRRQ